MRMYYDHIDVHITYSYHQNAKAFWRWAEANVPRHRTLTQKTMPLERIHRRPRTKVVESLRKRQKPIFWRKMLDFLVAEGWPEYALVWTRSGDIYIFEKYLLQGAMNEVSRNRVR